jgi:hypothetical protein
VNLEHRDKKRKRKYFRFYIYARIFAYEPLYGSFWVPGLPEGFDADEMAQKQQRLLNKKWKGYKTGKRLKERDPVKLRKRRNKYKTNLFTIKLKTPHF